MIKKVTLSSRGTTGSMNRGRCNYVHGAQGNGYFLHLLHEMWREQELSAHASLSP